MEYSSAMRPMDTGNGLDQSVAKPIEGKCLSKIVIVCVPAYITALKWEIRNGGNIDPRLLGVRNGGGLRHRPAIPTRQRLSQEVCGLKAA